MFHLEQLKFKPVPVNAKLELGSNSTLRCKADGRVAPRIKWYREGFTQLPDNVRDNDGTLVFASVQNTDAGLYTCLATNDDGAINATIRVDVISK